MNFLDYDLYKDKSGIYMIKNLVNGKVYIGQTTMRFVKRFWHHRWMLNHNKHDNIHLQSAWNKYGQDNFEFSVIYVLENDESLDSLEKDYIAKYNAIDFGYNIQAGGNVVLCNYIPEASRKKVGELNRQRLLGTKLSEKTRLKMSEQRIGSKNGFAKLTEDDVREIKKMIKDGVKPKKIYTKYNITYGNFKMIRSGKTWKHVSI